MFLCSVIIYLSVVYIYSLEVAIFLLGVFAFLLIVGLTLYHPKLYSLYLCKLRAVRTEY